MIRVYAVVGDEYNSRSAVRVGRPYTKIASAKRMLGKYSQGWITSDANGRETAFAYKGLLIGDAEKVTTTGSTLVRL